MNENENTYILGMTIPGINQEINPYVAGGIGLGVIIAIVIVVAILTKGCKTKQKPDHARGEGDKANGDVTEIYIGNLSYDMTEAQLRKEFERYGVVQSARVIGHHASGKSKGYGFIEMPHRKEAMVAIKSLNGRDILGRKLRVNEARHGSRRP